MDDTVVSLEKAKEILDNGLDQAKTILKSNDELNEVLRQVEAKIDEVPLLKATLTDANLLFDMVKSYAKKEYTAVTPKLIATVVSAFIYVIKRKDLIKDSIPVIGILDDIAVVAVALKFVEPELKAYAEWKEENSNKA